MCYGASIETNENETQVVEPLDTGSGLENLTTEGAVSEGDDGGPLPSLDDLREAIVPGYTNAKRETDAFFGRNGITNPAQREDILKAASGVIRETNDIVRMGQHLGHLQGLSVSQALNLTLQVASLVARTIIEAEPPFQQIDTRDTYN